MKLNLYKIFIFYPPLMQKAPNIGEFTAPDDKTAQEIANTQLIQFGGSKKDSRLFKIGTQIEI